MKNKSLKSIQFFKVLFLVGGLVFVSCSTKNKKSSAVIDTDKLEGVWEQTNYFRLSGTDTILKDDTKVQHKIYLDGYFMWNSEAREDMKEWHGYGSYTLKNDTLIETLTSMSIPLRDYTYVFPIVVEIKDGSLKQTIHYKENDINFQNIEIYKKVN